jgi:hypothetical protein
VAELAELAERRSAEEPGLVEDSSPDAEEAPATALSTEDPEALADAVARDRVRG